VYRKRSDQLPDPYLQEQMDRSSLKGKIILISGLILILVFFNVVVRIHLPGISNVDIRPQIVLIALAGYLTGPVLGFITGFVSNFMSDLILGYGLHYLPSWTIGNGFIGLLMGVYRLRKTRRLDKIVHLTHVTLALIIVNILSFAYASFIAMVQDTGLSTTINFNYFFVPAVLSNIIAMLALFPALLLAFGEIKLNFPVRIALINYYLTLLIVFLSWAIFAFNLADISGNFSEITEEKGNAWVRSFNHWTWLLVVTLVLSFVISGWISRVLVSPIVNLEKSVFEILKGRPDAVKDLAGYSKRKDEIGVLSSTIALLGEKLLETRKWFRSEMNKKMKFIHADDSGTDVLIMGIISMFGKEAYQSIGTDQIMGKTGTISNMDAINTIILATGLHELAVTYPETKVKRTLENLVLGLDEIIKRKEDQQALAVAVDMNLIFKGRLMILDLYAPLEQDFAYHLLENARALTQKEKRVTGYLNEPDLIGKIEEKWLGSEPIACEAIESVMNAAIIDGIISGYQIKQVEDLANFDEELKLTYSHSNFKHIKQLIGLLLGEGVQAKVQLEQKTSSFIYLDEWERLPDLNLEESGKGFSVAHKKEFDVVFEFPDIVQRDRFHALITSYAKMDDNENKKLLFGSWYQPLFCSPADIPGYQKIANLNLVRDPFYVCTYCREEDKDKISTYFSDRSFNFTTNQLWVNNAFFSYLNGDPA